MTIFRQIGCLAFNFNKVSQQCDFIDKLNAVVSANGAYDSGTQMCGVMTGSSHHNYPLFLQYYLVVLDGFDQHYQAAALSINSKQCGAVNEARQHHEIILWEIRESNPRQLGEKHKCYLCAMPPPQLGNFNQSFLTLEDSTLTLFDGVQILC